MRVFYQKQGRGLHAAVRFASVHGPLDTVALYKTERDARRFVEAANRSMDIEEEKQALAKIDPAQESSQSKAPHGWVCFNSGPTEWFWSEEREALEHELSDDIRPATHLEKYFFNKQGNQTHEHDTSSPQTDMVADTVAVPREVIADLYRFFHQAWEGTGRITSDGSHGKDLLDWRQVMSNYHRQSQPPQKEMDGEVDPWVIIEKLRIQHRDEIHNVWMPLVAELRQNHSTQANLGGEDLAPCPFCGGESGFLCPASQPQDGTWKAYCRECKSEGKWADTKVEAAAFWNNRPLSAADLVSYGDVYRALNEWSKEHRISDDVAPIARKIIALVKEQGKET